VTDCLPAIPCRPAQYRIVALENPKFHLNSRYSTLRPHPHPEEEKAKGSSLTESSSSLSRAERSLLGLAVSTAHTSSYGWTDVNHPLVELSPSTGPSRPDASSFGPPTRKSLEYDGHKYRRTNRGNLVSLSSRLVVSHCKQARIRNHYGYIQGRKR